MKISTTAITHALATVLLASGGIHSASAATLRGRSNQILDASGAAAQEEKIGGAATSPFQHPRTTEATNHTPAPAGGTKFSVMNVGKANSGSNKIPTTPNTAKNGGAAMTPFLQPATPAPKVSGASTVSTMNVGKANTDETLKIRQKHYMSSPKLSGTTLNSYYARAVQSSFQECEDWCRNESNCNSYRFVDVFRADGQGNACYISSETAFTTCTENPNECPHSYAFTFNRENSVSLIPDGDIRIGAGSYYTDDDEVTMTYEGAKDLWDAWEWVQLFDNTENPVIMFQLVPTGGGVGKVTVWAHRLKFMSQNIDMDPTTQSVTPFTYAEGQANWLADGLGGDVYVRTNEWYNKNPPYDVWAVVQLGSGQTAGASRIDIGPGSYYTGDNTITMINEEIKDEQSAFEFVSSFDDTDNQVAIFQLGPFGSNPNEQVLMVHFKKFMFQNLDAQTGATPGDFVVAQANFWETQPADQKSNSHLLGAVYSRSNYWWSSNDTM